MFEVWGFGFKARAALLKVSPYLSSILGVLKLNLPDYIGLSYPRDVKGYLLHY